MANYINTTASGLVKTGFGRLLGFTVNSHTNGTIALVDGLEGSSAAATGTLTQSVGATVPATHATSEIVSSGVAVPGTHPVTVFTNAGTNHKDAVKATAVLTCDGTIPTANDTVEVDSIVYTFKATPVAANQVALGTTAAQAMENLYNALAFGRGPVGTDAQTRVDVVLTSSLVITVTAKVGGTAANSYTKAESSTHLDWDGAGGTLTGGLAAETVTIGATVYTFKDTLSPDVAYQVKIGADVEASLDNLAKAINGTGTGGVEYSLGTVAHPDVVSPSHDATTITLRGRVPGTSLNTKATTETCAAASFPDTTLGGGTGASDAGVTTGAATITIGDTVYTFVDALSETYGADAIAYQVLAGANAAAALDNLKLAINGTGTAGTEYSTGTEAHPDVVATTNTDTVQTVRGRVPGTSLNTVATTETFANWAWADSTLGGGTGNSDAGVTTAAATFTIGDITYTGVIELSEALGATAVPYQIKWVTSEAVFIDNIKKAINGTGIAGTDYSTGTLPHPQVIATTNANDSQVVVAKSVGSAGNSIATTETMANYAWGASTLGSGTGASGKTIMSTVTLAAGPAVYQLPEPVIFDTGLSVVLGGVADVTLIVD